MTTHQPKCILEVRIRLAPADKNVGDTVPIPNRDAARTKMPALRNYCFARCSWRLAVESENYEQIYTAN